MTKDRSSTKAVLRSNCDVLNNSNHKILLTKRGFCPEVKSTVTLTLPVKEMSTKQYRTSLCLQTGL